MEELRRLRDNYKNLWNRLIELSKEDTANPYFNAFKRVTIQNIEERFIYEDNQMTLFDYLEKEENELKKENQTRPQFCIYCEREIADWEKGETVWTNRKSVRHFHLECYRKTLKGKE